MRDTDGGRGQRLRHGRLAGRDVPVPSARSWVKNGLQDRRVVGMGSFGLRIACTPTCMAHEGLAQSCWASRGIAHLARGARCRCVRHHSEALEGRRRARRCRGRSRHWRPAAVHRCQLCSRQGKACGTSRPARQRRRLTPRPAARRSPACRSAAPAPPLSAGAGAGRRAPRQTRRRPPRCSPPGCRPTRRR